MPQYSERLVEFCARAGHEMNRIYCEAHGDFTQAPWEAAPPWQQNSAMLGVLGALSGNTPEQSHEGWLAEKTRTGWKYGPVKDAEQKEHPCFLPYAELPAAQQVKDHLYLSAVRAMHAAIVGDARGGAAEPPSESK